MSDMKLFLLFLLFAGLPAFAQTRVDVSHLPEPIRLFSRPDSVAISVEGLSLAEKKAFLERLPKGERITLTVVHGESDWSIDTCFFLYPGIIESIHETYVMGQFRSAFKCLRRRGYGFRSRQAASLSELKYVLVKPSCALEMSISKESI